MAPWPPLDPPLSILKLSAPLFCSLKIKAHRSVNKFLATLQCMIVIDDWLLHVQPRTLIHCMHNNMERPKRRSVCTLLFLRRRVGPLSTR